MRVIWRAATMWYDTVAEQLWIATASGRLLASPHRKGMPAIDLGATKQFQIPDAPKNIEALRAFRGHPQAREAGRSLLLLTMDVVDTNGAQSYGGQVGYSWTGAETFDQQLGSIGIDIGHQLIGDHLWLGYTPRFVIGTQSEFDTRHFAYGMRHGLTLRFLLSLLSVEISHQMLQVNGTLRHDLRFLVGVNPLAPFILLYHLIKRDFSLPD